ncbi:MAG: hypothetical protein IT406_01155 [Candidatus Yanofskybacteria bacterium]|nr:hypothetical protein [Candidatus Yanofskybacteria bacterium]
MSLLCTETREDILFGTPLFAAVVPFRDGSVSFALSATTLDRIPRALRGSSSVRVTDGLNIHAAHSTENPGGSYTWSKFRAGDFQFSISAETARQFLPACWRESRDLLVTE